VATGWDPLVESIVVDHQDFSLFNQVARAYEYVTELTNRAMVLDQDLSCHTRHDNGSQYETSQNQRSSCPDDMSSLICDMSESMTSKCHRRNFLIRNIIICMRAHFPDYRSEIPQASPSLFRDDVASPKDIDWPGTVSTALNETAPATALNLLGSGPRAISCPELGDGRVVLPRFREARQVLRSDVFVCAPLADGALDGFPKDVRHVLEPVRSWALYSDPPTHPRLRKHLSRALAPLNNPALAGSIRANARHLLTSVVRRGTGDAVSDIAVPLPITTISDLLGLPSSDRELLKEWSDDLIAIIEPELTPDQAGRVHQAWTNLWDYFSQIVDQRRATPGDDAISLLVTGREQSSGLSQRELVSNCISLLLGGHETTTSLLASLLLELGRRPDLRVQLVEDPNLIPGFVEEVLRTNGPSKITARQARREVQLGGYCIEAGQRVVLLLSAAGRDPDVFESPQTFALRRRPNTHLGFGHGAHACFGAALARLQARILIEEFLSPEHELDVNIESVVWQQSQVLRSASRLAVRRNP